MNTLSGLIPKRKCATGLKLFAGACTLAWLAACGGGGEGNTPAAGTANVTSPTAASPSPSNAATQTSTLAATATLPTLGYTAASVAQQCVAPRVGAGFTDVQGTIDTEKRWVRAHMDETYLFYKDVPVVDAARFTPAAYEGSVFNTLRAYFSALLTPKVTASGNDVDQFSFAAPTQTRVNQQAGISSGYGISFARIDNPNATATLVIRVLRVEPNSPGDLAGVERGDTVKSIDGVDINDPTEAGQIKLNAGLNPNIAAKTTTFGLQADGSDVIEEVVVVSSTNISTSPVEIAKTLRVGDKKVGYLALNSFSAVKAQTQLINAIKQFKSDGINDLVLDLRYNGGGIVLLANQLSYMIGDAKLKDKIFEQSICNDKKPFDVCKQPNQFIDTTIGDDVNNVKPDLDIPQLGLKRVFVLTTGSTCSASESVINGLSPYLQVVRIGGTTCGKPFGFIVKDNCGTSYAALQIKVANANGFAEYEDGFAPTCRVADDLSKERGDPAELMLAGAVNYIKTGSCPAAALNAQNSAQKTLAPSAATFKMMRSPMEEIRIMSTSRDSLK